MTETLETRDGRTVLRIERRLAHRPERVWRALTEPAELAAWFPFEVQLEPVVGGMIRFADRSGAGDRTEGLITELDPPRVLAYSWRTDLLRWELEPHHGGTLLIFTHTFADRAGAASFTAGWQACLDALAELLSGRTPATPDRDAMDAAHERYVAAFGLAHGVVEDNPGGWRVRFERQLMRPVEAAWAALTGGRPIAVGDAVPPEASTGTAVSTVTAVDPPKALEFDWLAGGVPAGRVCWELSHGTGQGARLVLTSTGPRELAAERDAALGAGRTRVEQLAAGLAAQPRSAQR